MTDQYWSSPLRAASAASRAAWIAAYSSWLWTETRRNSRIPVPAKDGVFQKIKDGVFFFLMIREGIGDVMALQSRAHEYK